MFFKIVSKFIFIAASLFELLRTDTDIVHVNIINSAEH